MRSNAVRSLVVETFVIKGGGVNTTPRSCVHPHLAYGRIITVTNIDVIATPLLFAKPERTGQLP